MVTSIENHTVVSSKSVLDLQLAPTVNKKPSKLVEDPRIGRNVLRMPRLPSSPRPGRGRSLELRESRERVGFELRPSQAAGTRGRHSHDQLPRRIHPPANER